MLADVDVVIDLVGDAQDQHPLAEVLRPGGLLVAVPGGVSPELAAAAEAAGVRATPFLVEPDGAALTRIAELIDAGLVARGGRGSSRWSNARAHTSGRAGRTRGKLVLSVAYLTHPETESANRSKSMFYEIRRYQAVPGRRDEWVRYMEDVVIPYQQSHGMTVTASFVDEEDPDGYIWIRRSTTRPRREPLRGRLRGRPLEERDRPGRPGC